MLSSFSWWNWMTSTFHKTRVSRRRFRPGKSHGRIAPAAFVSPLEPRVMLSAITVNTAADNTTSDDLLTLREAVAVLNDGNIADGVGGLGGRLLTAAETAQVNLDQQPGLNDQILFSAAVDGAPILLGSQLTIGRSVTFVGNGASNTILDGQDATRLIHSQGTNQFLGILGMTLRRGSAIGSRFGSEAGGGAIAITNGSVLMVSDCVFSDNSARNAPGGAIAAVNTEVRVSHCFFNGNSTDGDEARGGAIYSSIDKVSIFGSTFTNNSTTGDISHGGAVSNPGGKVTVVQSTFVGSSIVGDSTNGGAINAHELEIYQSTITANSSEFGLGGGIFATTSLTVFNSIIAGNTNGLAPDAVVYYSYADVLIVHSVIGFVTEWSNLSGRYQPSGPGPDSSGNFIGGPNVGKVDPLLGPLGYHGGLVPTMPLLPGSVAIDAALEIVAVNPLFLSQPLTTDQRGGLFVRNVGGVDIGAYERQAVADLSLVVDIATDEYDGDFSAGDLSLREAVALANGSVGTDTITFAPVLDGVTIVLTMGQLTITDSATITGNGAANTLIDGQESTRIFDISGASTFSVNSLTLQNARSPDGDAGGAIRIQGGTLNVRDSVLKENHSEVGGGAIQSLGASAFISGTVFSGNSAGRRGGGIDSIRGTLSLVDSTFQGNSAEVGGAVQSEHTDLTIQGTTFHLNTGSANGGAIFLPSGSAKIVNSTFSENSAGSLGGAIAGSDTSPMTIVNSTFTLNSVNGDGGAIYTRADFVLQNSIVAGNTTHGLTKDLDVLSISASNSLIGTAFGSGLAATGSNAPDTNGNYVGDEGAAAINPGLAPLADNGGPTLTHRLLAGSLAIDRGSNPLAVDPTTTEATALGFDQRGTGFPRIIRGAVDMGAFEFTPYDFGDAPAGYPVTLTEDGARHVAIGPTLGATRDDDEDGAHSANATGDGPDDDGVTFPATLIAGATQNLTINASGAGVLNVWADWNGDGDFRDDGEQIATNRAVSAGDNALSIAVPSTVSGPVVFRFRLTSGQVASPAATGLLPDGEVEDYVVTAQKVDFGDAPVGYPVTLAEDGARHIATGPTLGATRDAEGDGTHSTDATGDGADEDGVTFPSMLIAGTTLNLTITASSAGYLNAWADWNGDGDFSDDGEQIVSNLAVMAGPNHLSTAIPLDAADHVVFRFRLTSEIVESPTPTGLLLDGEVEDFLRTVDHLDFGDAPEGYAVTRNEDGARHIAAGATLGATRDNEADGTHSDDATTDGTDEDGVGFSTTLIAGSTQNLAITTSGAGFLNAWADWNRDGDFRDDGEQIASNVAMTAGSNILVTSIPLTTSGDIVYRFRLTSESVESPAPTGLLPDGEVEDYVRNSVTLDFGDAPAGYPVTLSEDGARHVAAGPTLGATRDNEADGTHSTDASGDGADEDGVTLPTTILANSVFHATVNASGAGYLNTWADWNGDGDFGDAGEQITTNFAVRAGSNPLAIYAPASTNGRIVFRFRLTSAQVASPTATGLLPDGEVEDYVVAAQQLDFGDAPSGYAVTLAEDGARHIATGITLGATRDVDGDGTHSANASGDGADEDGVTLPATLFAHTVPHATVTVTGGSGVLNAWADWNRDGDFTDSGEQFATNVAVNAGANSVTIRMPGTVTTGDVAMRFRLTSARVESPLSTGLLPDGEVEDYIGHIVANSSQRPVINGFGTTIAWTEGLAPVLLTTSAASVTDVDSPNFDGGLMTVSLTNNAKPGDVLGIRSQGTGVGQIAVTGNSITYRASAAAAVVIGTFTGGTNGDPLVITFTASATPAAVSVLLRNLTYSSTSDNPTNAPRTVQITVSDGDGSLSLPATKSINVVPVNDGPVLNNWGGPATFTEDGPPAILDGDASITDADSFDFANGTLFVQTTVNGQSTDQLGIASGHETEFGRVTATLIMGPSAFNVLVDGVVVGRLTGGNSGSTMTVLFNASATAARASAVLQSVQFWNTSHVPSNKPRTMLITLTDGDGGKVQNATKTVNVAPVNDAPIIGGVTRPMTFYGTPILPFPTATLTDLDTAAFTGGTLTTQSTNGAMGDTLGIRNQDLGAGQINVVNGNQIRSGMTVIGTFTGGVNGAPLIISLNAAATTANVQALMRNVQFTTTAPGTLPRTLGITLQEANGTTSNTVSQTPASICWSK
jgi:predicted outer membrane repeat protein